MREELGPDAQTELQRYLDTERRAMESMVADILRVERQKLVTENYGADGKLKNTTSELVPVPGGELEAKLLVADVVSTADAKV